MSTTYPEGEDDEIIETTATVPPAEPESETEPEPAPTTTSEPAATPTPEPEPEIIIDEEIGDGRDVPSVKDKQR